MDLNSDSVITMIIAIVENVTLFQLFALFKLTSNFKLNPGSNK